MHKLRLVFVTYILYLSASALAALFSLLTVIVLVNLGLIRLGSARHALLLFVLVHFAMPIPPTVLYICGTRHHRSPR